MGKHRKNMGTYLEKRQEPVNTCMGTLGFRQQKHGVFTINNGFHERIHWGFSSTDCRKQWDSWTEREIPNYWKQCITEQWDYWTQLLYRFNSKHNSKHKGFGELKGLPTNSAGWQCGNSRQDVEGWTSGNLTWLWNITIFHGKTHYFDWAISNSYVKLPEGRYGIAPILSCAFRAQPWQPCTKFLSGMMTTAEG